MVILSLLDPEARSPGSCGCHRGNPSDCGCFAHPGRQRPAEKFLRVCLHSSRLPPLASSLLHPPLSEGAILLSSLRHNLERALWMALWPSQLPSGRLNGRHPNSPPTLFFTHHKRAHTSRPEGSQAEIQTTCFFLHL